MRALRSAVLPSAFDDRRVVLVDHDLLGAAQVGKLDVFELDAQVLEDRLAADHDGDVLQHGFAAIAVAGGLHRAHLEGAAELVDHQRGEGFAFDFLGDEEQRLAGVDDLFEDGNEVLDAA